MLSEIKNASPFISVVIPAYNSETYIAGTLETVFSQTYSNFEVVVSDDGSTDHTENIARDVFQKFSLVPSQFLKNEHEGPGATRNKGILAARGEWISFLDSDDRWMPEKLTLVSDYIQAHADIGIVSHSRKLKTGGEERIVNDAEHYKPSLGLFLSLYKASMFSTSAVTVKKEHLLEAGLFDTTLPSAQDYDLWLRLGLIENIKFGFIEKPLGFYIVRYGSISADTDARLRCMLEIGRKYAKHVQKYSRFSFVLRREFEGKAYATAGLAFLRKGNLLKGFLFLVTGMLKWPFRGDWADKAIKRILRRGF